jgi:hypothetical protein
LPLPRVAMIVSGDTFSTHPKLVIPLEDSKGPGKPRCELFPGVHGE